jgi:hypothetical protein
VGGRGVGTDGRSVLVRGRRRERERYVAWRRREDSEQTNGRRGMIGRGRGTCLSRRYWLDLTDQLHGAARVFATPQPSLRP